MSERADCVFVSSLGKGDNLHQQGLNFFKSLSRHFFFKGISACFCIKILTLILMSLSPSAPLVLSAFPLCQMTEEDLIQNPQFCKLLATLSQHVDRTGLTQHLRRDLEKVRPQKLPTHFITGHEMFVMCFNKLYWRSKWQRTTRPCSSNSRTWRQQRHGHGFDSHGMGMELMYNLLWIKESAINVACLLTGFALKNYIYKRKCMF